MPIQTTNYIKFGNGSVIWFELGSIKEFGEEEGKYKFGRLESMCRVPPKQSINTSKVGRSE